MNKENSVNNSNFPIARSNYEIKETIDDFSISNFSYKKVIAEEENILSSIPNIVFRNNFVKSVLKVLNKKFAHLTRKV